MNIFRLLPPIVMYLSALLGAVPLNAQDAPRLSVLQAEYNVWDATAEDITGDGVREVLLLTCDELARPLKKELLIFVGDAENQYPDAPSIRMPLPDTASVLFFAETDGMPPRELVAADAVGARVYRYRDGEMRQIARHRFPSYFPYRSREPIFLKNGAKDLTGDGIEEWLIPAPEGYEIRRGDQRLALLPCDIAGEIRRGESLYVINRFPAIQTFEMESSQVKGLAFLSDEYADFFYGENWDAHKQYRIPLFVQEKWDSSAKMADITGNGFPDLVVTQTRGTINMQAVTHIYIASELFKYPEKPTATFNVRGGITSPQIIDVDNDGMMDVLLISVPLGFKNFVNFFVRGKLAVNAEVYFFDGKTYGEKPAYSSSLLMDAPDGREQVAYAMGDFNGDGHLDLAMGKSSDAIVVHAGDPPRLIAPRPWLTLDVPGFGVAQTVDIDDNNKKDIILMHPGGPNSRRVDIIVF